MIECPNCHYQKGYDVNISQEVNKDDDDFGEIECIMTKKPEKYWKFSCNERQLQWLSICPKCGIVFLEK